MSYVTDIVAAARTKIEGIGSLSYTRLPFETEIEKNTARKADGYAFLAGGAEPNNTVNNYVQVSHSFRLRLYKSFTKPSTNDENKKNAINTAMDDLHTIISEFITTKLNQSNISLISLIDIEEPEEYEDGTAIIASANLAIQYRYRVTN